MCSAAATNLASRLASLLIASKGLPAYLRRRTKEMTQ
jgi:hypothetical protein